MDAQKSKGPDPKVQKGRGAKQEERARLSVDQIRQSRQWCSPKVRGEIQKKEGKGKVESRKGGKEEGWKVSSGKEGKEGGHEICAWGGAPRGKEGVIHQSTAHLSPSN